MQNFLDFFAVPDWFNRPEPYGFNTERIIFVILCVLACIFIPLKLKGNKTEGRKALIILWICAVVLDVIKYVFYNAYCVVNKLGFSQLELPLWTCSIYLFAMPISLFGKREKITKACDAFICSISMIGGFINFLFPSESLFSFMGLHTFLYHFILLISPIIMLTSRYYKPEFNHFKGAVLVFLIYAVPVFIFDNIFMQDYMFIYDGTWFGPMADFAVLMPHRLVWTVICVLGHIAVATLMVFLESKLIKQKNA